MTRIAHKILIVEDEADILQLVKMYLEKGRLPDAHRHRPGYKPSSESRRSVPDLVILDLMLPEMDGLEGATRFVSHPNTAMLPVLMLTAKAEESDTVIGLELGADDYVPKPFSPKALVARVKALLRRMDRSAGDSQSTYQYGSLRMDLSRHEVKVRDREIPLTAKEFGLLEHLVRNVGRVLTRDVLLNSVWGYDYYGTTRTVDVHVRRLKQKIPLLNDAIVSIKSLGYKLRDSDASV